MIAQILMFAGVAHATTSVEALGAGDLLITEFMADPNAVADNKGEWFEIYNNTLDAVDLNGMLVYDAGADDFTVSTSVVVAAGDYAVIGNNSNTSTNGGVTVDYAYVHSTHMALSNSTDAIYIANSSGLIDGINWTYWNKPFSAGRAAGLDDSYFDDVYNNSMSRWCKQSTVYGSGDQGTPGGTNDDCGYGLDVDNDGYTSVDEGGDDCDDSNASVNPGASEYCDTIDNDCDGSIDEGSAVDAGTWYEDWDSDGYGDPLVSTTSCDQPSGYVADDTDCDDLDGSVFPGADEYCDGIDNDCDGSTDESGAVDGTTYYEDWDSDGYGDAGVYTVECEQPSGYVTDDTDCDDTDASVNPGASDLTVDGIDQDCDGTDGQGILYAGDLVAGDLVFTEVQADPTKVGDNKGEWFEVYNASGYLVDLAGLEFYDSGTDNFFVTGSLTVADGDFLVFGNNSNSGTNGGLTVDYAFVYSTDMILGNSADSLYVRNSLGTVIDGISWTYFTRPFGAGAAGGLDPLVYDATANDNMAYWCKQTTAYGLGDKGTPGVDNESCGLSIDADADGYVDATIGGDDCDDSDASVNPGASEYCDGVDNDCDGSTDESGALDETTWYEDWDSDGYGDPAWTWDACDQPSGYVANSDDCDDTDASVSPAADEYCDGIDNDCDGSVDESGAVDETTWYEDWDSDGYGDATVWQDACDQPSGYVADATDCDDTDATVNPGESDLYIDGIDQDCDGVDGQGILYQGDLIEGDLVFTEIQADPNKVADNKGEWFEVYNASGYIIDLQGLEFYDAGSDNFFVTTSLTVADGDHLVIGNNSNTGTNGGVTVDYAYVHSTDMALSNSSDSIYVRASDGTVIDGFSYTYWTRPFGVGAAGGLDPNYYNSTSNNDMSKWCDQTSTYGLGDAGTPGSTNDSCGLPVDVDGDGYYDVASGGTDCDDSDASVYPGATEHCDGIDNDCDGTIDEAGAADATTWYADADSDGYGDVNTYVYECDQPSGYVSNSTDCDDTDASVNPGASDPTVDGIDQDCDGVDGQGILYAADLIAGDLFFTEVMPDPNVVNDAYGEWFEIYNDSGYIVDIEGLTFYDSGTDTFTVAGSYQVADQDYAVFGASSNTAVNGGVPVDVAYSRSTFLLGNGADSIYVKYGALVIDGVSWTYWDRPGGVGIAGGLKATAFSASGNDSMANWAKQTSTYGGGDKGTPGAANDF